MSEWRAVTANGRVNLIGEHTDYNGGWVLPTAIPQATTVEVRERPDLMVFCETSLYGKSPGEYRLGSEKPSGTWLDYVQGATQLLTQDSQPVRGFDLRVRSNIPAGSGLSSSAALEVALLRALSLLFHFDLSELEIARMGQKIENDFVGARVGILDQMACALARFGEALYLDTQSLEFERIPLPMGKMDLVVIDSGISHRHSTGDYNQRRAECEEAARLLRVPSLRAVTNLTQLDALPEPLRRRARHVVTENVRVHEAVLCLKQEDLRRLGELFFASHASQRDDFAVSIPEIDLLVELCHAQPATFGARLTGGGFGGSIVALTERGLGEDVARTVASSYAKETGIKPGLLVS